MKYYQYLFYKVYSFTKKLGNWEVAESAMFYLSILLEINILKIAYIFKKPLLGSVNYDKIFFILYFIIVGINYYLFLHKKKYKDIEKRFKKEGRVSKIIGNIVVFIYFIGTMVSMFFW